MSKQDVTGRSRVMRNLMGQWLGQMVVVVSGFVIPRLIDDNLGAVSLGLWDFGWSTVSYFRYMGLGTAAGLNRFVALHNAKGDVDNLKRVVSSTVFMQIIVGVSVVLASFGVSWLVPYLFDELSPDKVVDSQLVIVFLGCSLAVRMTFMTSRGILTGHHLWVVSSAVTAFGDILQLIGMFAALKLGGTLAHLGMTVFAVAVMTELLGVVMAKRVYRHPMISWPSVDKKTMRELIVFGVKVSIGGLSRVLVVQTSALCLAASAGPAALAAFARPLALFGVADKFISLYASQITPVAGSLHGLKRDAELRELLLSSLQATFAMTIPALLLLSGYGDAVVRLWMGDDYVVPLLAPIMGVALLLPYAHSVAMRILVGVNAHGKVALRSLIHSALVLAVSCAFAFSYGWTPVVAAIVVGVSLMAGPGLTVVTGTCRRFNVGFIDYLRDAVWRPLLCNLPLLAVIVVSRLVDKDVTALDAIIWSAAGGIPVLILYWIFILPVDLKNKVRRRVGLLVETS